MLSSSPLARSLPGDDAEAHPLPPPAPGPPTSRGDGLAEPMPLKGFVLARPHHIWASGSANRAAYSVTTLLY